jgi:hypothetical protein
MNVLPLIQLRTYEVILSAEHLMDTRSQNTCEAETQGHESSRHSPLKEHTQSIVWRTITYRRSERNSWSLLQMLSDVAALKIMPTGFGRVHCDKDYRMCTGYKGAWLPFPSMQTQPLTCYFLPNFSLLLLRNSDTKSKSMSCTCIAHTFRYCRLLIILLSRRTWLFLKYCSLYVDVKVLVNNTKLSHHVHLCDCWFTNNNLSN